MCEPKIQEKSLLQNFSLSFLAAQFLGPFSLLSFSPYKRQANTTFLSSRPWLIPLLTLINAHHHLLHIHRKPTVFLCLCSLLSHWAMAITLILRKASKIIIHLPDTLSDRLADLLVSLNGKISLTIYSATCSLLQLVQTFGWQKNWQWSFQILPIKQPLLPWWIEMRCFTQ